MNLYLYMFYEDGTIQMSLHPPTEGDIESVEEGIIDVIKIEHNNYPTIYSPESQSEVWLPLENCELITICGDLYHMPAGTEPYNDEEE